ncbi:MAG TPA: hypothetical protein PKM43_20530, partial [Verrucomicrobiota bacterium]|nr:hypothetical protein [Verrucomicrobiota bacterium]
MPRYDQDIWKSQPPPALLTEWDSTEALAGLHGLHYKLFVVEQNEEPSAHILIGHDRDNVRRVDTLLDTAYHRKLDEDDFAAIETALVGAPSDAKDILAGYGSNAVVAEIEHLEDRLTPAILSNDKPSLLKLDEEIRAALSRFGIEQDPAQVAYPNPVQDGVVGDPGEGEATFHISLSGRFNGQSTHGMAGVHGLQDGTNRLHLAARANKNGIGWSIIEYHSNEYSEEYNDAWTQAEATSLVEIGEAYAKCKPEVRKPEAVAVGAAVAQPQPKGAPEIGQMAATNGLPPSGRYIEHDATPPVSMDFQQFMELYARLARLPSACESGISINTAWASNQPAYEAKAHISLFPGKSLLKLSTEELADFRAHGAGGVYIALFTQWGGAESNGKTLVGNRVSLRVYDNRYLPRNTTNKVDVTLKHEWLAGQWSELAGRWPETEKPAQVAQPMPQPDEIVETILKFEYNRYTYCYHPDTMAPAVSERLEDRLTDYFPGLRVEKIATGDGRMPGADGPDRDVAESIDYMAHKLPAEIAANIAMAEKPPSPLFNYLFGEDPNAPTPQGYEAYTCTLHPAHYGEGLNSSERERITFAISTALTEQFPGIKIVTSDMEGAATPTRGPDENTIEKIDRTSEQAFHATLDKMRAEVEIEESVRNMGCLRYGVLDSETLAGNLHLQGIETRRHSDLTGRVPHAGMGGAERYEYTSKIGQTIYVLERSKPYAGDAYEMDVWQFEKPFNMIQADAFVTAFDRLHK